MKNIITIAGAGSGYTPGILLTALNQSKDFPIKEIRLYDINEERNADMGIIIDFLLKRNNHDDIKLIITTNPKEAFSETNFVFSQIRVGGMEMREYDEKIPLKYGLVGQETCGLGGFSYGMRSMKGFLEMVQYIQEYAPDAWILNYTNPESIVAEAVRRKFPNIKIINACDMTIGIEEMLEESFGYDRKNFLPQYYGLNHFGWYKEIYDLKAQKDIMPEILQKINRCGFDISWIDETWGSSYKIMAEMATMFPSHLPNIYLQYYLFTNRVIEKSNPSYTRANIIMNTRLQTIKDTVKKINENKDLDTIDYESNCHGLYIIEIAISILKNKNGRFMLIVPNKGAIPNLRQDAVVEIPCYVNARGVEPISLREDIPDFHKGLMEAQVASEKLLVDAFFDQSYQKALEAFTLNQSVPNAVVAKQILDEMIEVNGDYWVELKKEG